jgi:uncharacterized protein (UPF0332 family)
MNRFANCLKAGKLREFKASRGRINLETRAAKQDLQEAQDRLGNNKYKYATIAAYYSFFHSARLLLYLKGYREKSHSCLKIAIEALYVGEGILEPKFIEYFEETMGLREAADYQSIFSKEGAVRAVSWADEFFKEAKKISKDLL